jgi:tripartite-type tricarboxylate transporter receptor subunit TctC
VVHTGPPIFLVTAKKPYQTIQDLQQAKGLKFGSPSMGGDVIAEAAVIETLKLDAKIILGITAPELVLSLQKGEMDAIFGTETIAAKATKDGAGKALFTMHKKGSLLPDLPLFVNIAKMQPDTDLLVKEFSGLSMTAFLPPNTPKDKTDYLRKVFSKISENKDSQQELIKALGVKAWYGYTAGDSAQKSVEELKARKDVPDKIKQLVDKYRG